MNRPNSDPSPAPGTSSFPAWAGEPPALLCDASDWGVLAVGGVDAPTFLQGQLSSDAKGLPPGAGQWTSYNSPKGRMLANGFLWRSPGGDGYRVALAAEVAEPAKKRLSMFVLRSKVTIADLGPTHRRLGIAGRGAGEALAIAMGSCPPPGAARVQDGAEIVALPDGRLLVVVPNEHADAIRARLAAATVPGDAQAWRRFAILAGTALVHDSTQDQLLPQAINLDVLGGVVLNRDKGCFPGQEIIKRAQALGQIKERMYAFTTTGPAPALGTKLFGETFGAQSCGVVVESAGAPAGGSMLLATVQVRAALADELHLGTPDGPELVAQALPYAIPAPGPGNRPA